MNVGVISMRYTRALLKYAQLNGEAESVYNEMMVLARCFIDVPRLRASLASPALAAEQKTALCVTACGGKACASTQNFIKLLIKSERLNLLQFMANSYVDLYRKQNNITRGKLITAVPVSSEIEEKMRNMIEYKTKGKVEFVTETDPEIVGGFILEYDTYRLDQSVSTQLRKTLQQFTNIKA